MEFEESASKGWESDSRSLVASWATWTSSGLFDDSEEYGVGRCESSMALSLLVVELDILSDEKMGLWTPSGKTKGNAVRGTSCATNGQVALCISGLEPEDLHTVINHRYQL